jgi:hypothetical protein
MVTASAYCVMLYCAALIGLSGEMLSSSYPE